MPTVQIVRVGAVASEAVAAIAAAVEAGLGCRVELDANLLDPNGTYDPSRGQYNSTELLHRLDARRSANADKVLGITEVDLFIPILTYVFGEALLDRPPAIISLKRLTPQFYGLPKDPALLLNRAKIEALHEIGHTFGLIHCPQYDCIMHASRVADEIDLKGPDFCPDCMASLPGAAGRH
jgi:archaemetzincin